MRVEAADEMFGVRDFGVTMGEKAANAVADRVFAGALATLQHQRGTGLFPGALNHVGEPADHPLIGVVVAGTDVIAQVVEEARAG